MESKLPPIPEDVLIAEFQNLTEELGHIPSPEEMDEKGRFSAATYDEAFLSWARIEEKAGYKEPDEIDREAYIREIRRLYNELGRVPRKNDLIKHSRYPIDGVYDYFLTLYQALVLAGLNPRAQQRPGHKHLLTILQRLAVELDRIPEPEDMDRHGPEGYDSDLYIDAFSSWSYACYCAGLYDEFDEGSPYG